LLVVLVIAGLILTVTPPLFSRAMPGTQLKGAARQITSALKFARSHAVVTQQETQFRLDVEQRFFEVSGRNKQISLPEDLEYRLFTARAEQINDSVGAVRFYPDGSSTGGRITLAYGDREYHVNIDWLTGHVKILE
jgi:general secretion pathway protein H